MSETKNGIREIYGNLRIYINYSHAVLWLSAVDVFDSKENKIINSFLVVLLGLLFWTGGSAFMRAQFWPGCEFWYQVSLLGILLLPYAYYRFILAFGGVRNGSVGRIYLMTMLICFWVNAQFGVFLESPKMIEKEGYKPLYMRSTLLLLYFSFRQDFF